MSGAPRVKSMHVTESKTRSILGLTGNKDLGPISTQKPVSKTSKKIDMSPEKGSIGGKNQGVAASSPPFRSAGVPSILRRQVSLNASCSSDASTDSFQSRASTGRIYRTSSNARGRRQLASKTKIVVVDSGSESSSPDDLQTKKRCAWVTSSSDQSYAVFHDEEWGVPVHDDKKLFELLVLSGALSELTWPAILNKRHLFREVFADFDPTVVEKFNEKKLVGPGSAASSLLSELKLRAIVENARQMSKVIDEFGSFHKYIWSFVNYKPIISRFRYPRQIPVKTPKADVISKDLIRRGFRCVGPTVIYSFMQVAGITNDHLCTCFRFQECTAIAESEEVKVKEDEQKTDKGIESCICNGIEDLNFASG
ncbi:putative DNA-3-methyladenine glycosylase I [Helianthus annuus]|nr:putative DNA-3-methyladenine glycosylase I [Helianthus annuus]KAJ0606829.1 putative DNA-3-methyladenine glycosylase I [Helianthus annuus]KAJ0772746.1 putative DNA-3-methyladenine glycosylase I [Helianthus annuus]KAJ0934193.1 putative DNA-3-methyladenine glycosylase I [Helianthus annuus]